jgi:hypothetical protein
MEAKLTALDTASAEAEWLHELLSDLLVAEKTNTSYSYEL